jgi:hypothetical protein
MRLKPNLAAWVMAGVGLLLAVYFLRTGEPTAQEIPFNAQAQSVLGGNTPLFFHAGGDTWLQPIAVYANAAFRAASAGATAGRIASAIAGSIDIALVFLVAYAIAGTAWAAFAAALVLLVTTGHTALSLTAIDAFFPAVFVLLWLYGVLGFLKRDSPRALLGAAAALGACVYSHPAGPLTAVFLWILTLAITCRRNRVRLFAATTVFFLMWAPAAAWFFLHPSTYPDTFGRWFVFAAHIRNPLDGLKAFFNPNTLGTRASNYWGFWDPSWLFFSSQSIPAPLPLLSAPFILLAVLRLRHMPRDAMALLTGAALIAPLAGATFGGPHYIVDAAATLPLLAILAGLGVDQFVAVLTGRKPVAIEDDVPMTAVDGWHDDDALPRT